MLNKNKRKIFITGGGGFIGANLIRALLKSNKYEVHVLIRNSGIPWRLESIADKIILHPGDITNYASIRRSVINCKPDYIIHLAVYGAYHFQTNLKKIMNVNILGTENLLRATIDIPYRLFINTGTSSEYGRKNGTMKETQICNPMSYYAATKLGATLICKVFSEIENKPILTFRLFSVYGPYEEYTRLIPTIMYSILKKKIISLSPGKQHRDFIFSEDVCRAYLKALCLGEKLKGEIINIGSGIEYTNKEIVENTFKSTKDITVVKENSYLGRAWDIPHWKADITHAKNILGFQAKYSIDKGLHTTYSWFKENTKYYQVFYEKK